MITSQFQSSEDSRAGVAMYNSRRPPLALSTTGVFLRVQSPRAGTTWRGLRGSDDRRGLPGLPVPTGRRLLD